MHPRTRGTFACSFHKLDQCVLVSEGNGGKRQMGLHSHPPVAMVKQFDQLPNSSLFNSATKKGSSFFHNGIRKCLFVFNGINAPFCRLAPSVCPVTCHHFAPRRKGDIRHQQRRHELFPLVKGISSPISFVPNRMDAASTRPATKIAE
jgi:hypothetical protein